jgi:hypothetical protein
MTHREGLPADHADAPDAAIGTAPQDEWYRDTHAATCGKERRAAAGLPEGGGDRESLDQWVAEQLAGLNESELLRVKAKLDEIAATRPVVDRRSPTEREIARRTAEKLRTGR